MAWASDLFALRTCIARRARECCVASTSLLLQTGSHILASSTPNASTDDAAPPPPNEHNLVTGEDAVAFFAKAQPNAVTPHRPPTHTNLC